MKILHIISGLEPKSGGTKTFLTQLIIKQKLNGLEPQLLSLSKKKNDFLDSIEYKEIKKTRIRTFIFDSFSTYKLSFKFLFWLIKNFSNYDCIHIHALFRFPVDVSMLLSSLWRVPTVFSPHGSFDRNLLFISNFKIFGILCKKLIMFVLLPSIHKVNFHFTTESEKNSCLFNVKNNRSFIIPIGIDIPSKSSLNSKIIRKKIDISKDTFLLGYLGRLQSKKNLTSLIKAYKKFNEDLKIKNKLIIIGPSEAGYKEKLLKLVRLSMIEDKVIFYKYIPHEEIFKYLNEIDLFVLPSYSENFGISVIESLSVGTPVLISNKVNLYQDIEKYNCGIVVETNFDSIFEGLKKIYFDINKNKKKFKQNSLLLVEDKYTWDKIIGKFKNLYSQITNNN